MTLLEKVRTGNRIQKRYRAPLTPLHRLLQDREVSDQAKARLPYQLKDVDPISLQRDIGILQARLLGKTSQDISLGATCHDNQRLSLLGFFRCPLYLRLVLPIL